VFALLGASQLTIKTSASGQSSTDSGIGPSYGLGGEIAVTPTLRVGADITIINGKGSASYSAASAGVRWSF